MNQLGYKLIRYSNSKYTDFLPTFLYYCILLSLYTLLGLILDSTGLAKPEVHVEVR